MGILMTGLAFFKSRLLESQGFCFYIPLIKPGHMALSTFDLNMFSAQRIGCLGMVKLWRRYPGGLIMAGCTIFAQGLFMNIGVAGSTSCSQAHKRGCKFFILSLQGTGILYKLCFMAFLAIHVFMFPKQFKPGLFMIKIFLSFRPVTQICFLSKVLDMAGFTGFKF